MPAGQSGGSFQSPRFLNSFPDRNTPPAAKMPLDQTGDKQPSTEGCATTGPIGPVRIKNLANGGVSIRIIRPPADTSTLRSVERRDHPTHLGIIGQGGDVIDLSEHHTSSFVDDEDGPLGNPVVTKNAVGVCHRSMGMKITQ